MKNRAEQATKGLDITREGRTTTEETVLLVRDGQDSWLCLAERWDHAIESLREQDVIDGETGEAEAYAALCSAVVALGSPVASINGTSRDSTKTTAAELVRRAVKVGMVESGEARLFACGSAVRLDVDSKSHTNEIRDAILALQSDRSGTVMQHEIDALAEILRDRDTFGAREALEECGLVDSGAASNTSW